MLQRFESAVSRLVLAVLVLCGSPPLAARAADGSSTSCAQQKLRAAGAYAECLLLSEARALRDGTTPDYSSCDRLLERRFARTERGAACADAGNLEDVKQWIGSCTVAGGVSRRPSEPTDDLLLAAPAAACVGPIRKVGRLLPGERLPCSGGSAASAGRLGALVITFGAKGDVVPVAEAVEAQLVAWLEQHGIPAASQLARVGCPTGATLDGQTKACFDVRVYVPFVPERVVSTFEGMYHTQSLVRGLELHDDLGEQLSFVEGKGLAWGKAGALLIALRKSLELPADAPSDALPAVTSVAATATTAASETVTVDTLLWTSSTHVTTKESGYEHRVLAPGFNGSDGSTGTWVLVGLGARVKNGDLKCLRGKFRDLATGATRIIDSGDCSSMERYVELQPPYVATGVEMKVSDNNVKGIGLGYGTPSYTVDPLAPDFLLVSPNAWVFDGTSSGTYAPDPSWIDAGWEYAVVGVEARATESNVSGLTVYLGRIATEPAEPTDRWNDYTVEEIEAALVDAINQVYDVAAETVTFEAVPSCPATIPSIELCGYLSAKGSYSTSEMDPVCKDTCDAVYESCKVTLDLCEAACCYGCVWGKTCSCNYKCTDERDDCYDGCTSIFTGSAEVDVQRVKGLEKLKFTDASIPFLVDGSSIAVEVKAEVSKLEAPTYWRLCQSGICVSDTTPIESDKIKARATGLITAKACPSGPPALYFQIEDVRVEISDWGIEDFVDDVVGVAQSSLDWLAENISDIFEYDLEDEYESVQKELEDILEVELNGLLVSTPIVPCS